MARKGSWMSFVVRYLSQFHYIFAPHTTNDSFSPHQLEFAIGRYEGDGVIGLELRQFDALMKLTVINCHRRARCLCGVFWYAGLVLSL